MDKNSLQEGNRVWKGRIALITLISLLAGMMCARFVASLSMILFGLNALWDVHPRRWLRERWWLFGLAWVVCFGISGFWSADKEEWFSHLQVKFPFLFLPLAFAFIPPFTPRQLRIFTWCLAGMMCAGAAYSISFLWHGHTDLVDSYKYAHVLPTPVYDDHIAFSALVAVSIAWMMFYAPQIPRRQERRLLYLLSFVLAVYLHVLAAKTGLVALYILLFGLIVYQLSRSLKTGVILMVSVVTLAVTAYSLFPTLRERIGYSIVTWRSYVMGERTGIYSDAGRLISYDLALKSIVRHPVSGVGGGDVFHEMKAGYSRWYPEVPVAQQLWPHNEFLTIAMAAGIPTAILFLLWILAPLRLVRRNRAGVYFVLVWLMLLVPLTVDLFLEVQFGVAVYLIFLLWQRSFLLRPSPEAQSISTQS